MILLDDASTEQLKQLRRSVGKRAFVSEFPVTVLSLYLLDRPDISIGEELPNTEGSLCEVVANHRLSSTFATLNRGSLITTYQNREYRTSFREEITRWLGSANGPNKDEIEVMYWVVRRSRQGLYSESLEEQVVRLEVYITLLRATNGPLWHQQLLKVDRVSQQDYLFRILMACFMKSAFQTYFLTSGEISCADRMIWRDFYNHCLNLQNELFLSTSSRMAAVTPSPADTNRTATTHAAILENLNLLESP